MENRIIPPAEGAGLFVEPSDQTMTLGASKVPWLETRTPTLQAPCQHLVGTWGQLWGLSVFEGSTGDREKELSFSQANLNCEPQGWRLSSHKELLKELKNLNCPRICDWAAPNTHPLSYEDVQNTSLHFRTGFPLPHHTALYLAQTLISKDTLKFLQYLHCQTNFLVHPALVRFGTEEDELAEQQQQQQAPRVCDRRAKQILETHQVSIIKNRSHSTNLSRNLHEWKYFTLQAAVHLTCTHYFNSDKF